MVYGNFQPLKPVGNHVMNSKLDLFRRRPIGEKILQSWDVTNTVSGCNWRDVFF